MKVGDLVLVDGILGEVIPSPDQDYLYFRVIDENEEKRDASRFPKLGQEYYIGISQIGNPRVVVSDRCGTGETIQAREWQR